MNEIPDPKPGSFTDAPNLTEEEITARLLELNAREKDPPLYGNDPSDFFVRGISQSIRKFNIGTNLVYYPGSHGHIGLSAVEELSESRVIYLDKIEAVIEKLKAVGYEAYADDVETFDPGVVDLLILLNFNHSKPPEQVKPGGFVICNDWWGAATSLRDDPNFELSGVVLEDPETREVSIATVDLGDYLTQVETNEEWIRAESETIFNLRREEVERFNESIRQDLQLDTANLPKAIKEFTAKTKTKAWIPRVPYKKSAGLFIFRKKVS